MCVAMSRARFYMCQCGVHVEFMRDNADGRITASPLSHYLLSFQCICVVTPHSLIYELKVYDISIICCCREREGDTRIHTHSLNETEEQHTQRNVMRLAARARRVVCFVAHALTFIC